MKEFKFHNEALEYVLETSEPALYHLHTKKPRVLTRTDAVSCLGYDSAKRRGVLDEYVALRDRVE